MSPTVPDVISRYQDAHDRRDAAEALTAFTPDARVVDDGHEFVGSDAIAAWIVGAASEFTFTRTFVSAEVVAANRWLVVNHVEGDFPGGVVDLRYEFVVTHDLISELVIAP